MNPPNTLNSHRPHWVYRAYGIDGSLLYVGVTYDPQNRLAAHRRNAAWWTEAVRFAWVKFPDYRTAFAAECAAITAEVPRHNVRYNPSHSRNHRNPRVMVK